MWTIYQDSPAYGCDDNPSYRWYAYKTEANGHISKNIGPFDLRSQAFEATQASQAVYSDGVIERIALETFK